MYYTPNIETSGRINYLNNQDNIELDQRKTSSETIQEKLIASYAHTKRRSMGGKSDKILPASAKIVAKPGTKSTKLTMELEDSDIRDYLRQNPHHKILEWLENKNLGKKFEAICRSHYLQHKKDIDIGSS